LIHAGQFYLHCTRGSWHIFIFLSIYKPTIFHHNCRLWRDLYFVTYISIIKHDVLRIVMKYKNGVHEQGPLMWTFTSYSFLYQKQWTRVKWAVITLRWALQWLTNCQKIHPQDAAAIRIKAIYHVTLHKSHDISVQYLWFLSKVMTKKMLIACNYTTGKLRNWTEQQYRYFTL
jgi:hypothetical protein